MSSTATVQGEQTEAATVLARTRAAAVAWAAKSPADRAAAVRAAGRALLEGADDLASILETETFKPRGEAFSAEVLGIADLVTYWCGRGPKLLAPRKGRIPKLDLPGKSARIEREPHGVVAIISPWNYPAALPMRVLIPALIAGNGVVLKPSEVTPASGRWLIERLQAHLGDVVGLVEGDGRAGAALIDAGPDFVHFTGSTATGRKVTVACAEQGIPCDVELGGKDCAIVLDDANVERTAAGLAWGVVHNAGQDCASVERIVVHRRIADRFLRVLCDQMLAITPEVPRLVTSQQAEIVRAHLHEAAELGGTFLVGGPVEAGDIIAPALVTDVPRSAKVWRDESFGPIAVVEIADDDDALIAAANDTAYGLGASVWTHDLPRGERVAKRLKAGMVWINNHAFTGAVPDLPWVGRGASGSGLTGSPDMLDHLTRPKLVVTDKSQAIEPWWYPYGPSLLGLMEALIERHRVGGIGATIRTLKALSARNGVLKASGKDA